MSARFRATLLAATLATLLAACGGPGDPDDAGAEAHGADHAAQESVSEPVEGARDITVTAVDIDFQPATLALAAGEPVNVTVVNQGETLHDFTLDAAGVHVNVEPQQSVTTSLTLDEPGSYQAVCTVPGHEEAGMVVDLEVE